MLIVMNEEQQQQEQPSGPVPRPSNIADFVVGALASGVINYVLYRPEYDTAALTFFNAAIFGGTVGILR
ncbi:hypothetical protein HZB03_00750 [Candidatus Woesearchaeota archaeon]|nr:hypothetical protein [Candidatus Woesearchaeota archaeon]